MEYILNFDSVPRPANYRLLSIIGDCVSQGILQQGNNTISMQVVADNIYILEVTEADGKRTIVRVIKEWNK